MRKLFSILNLILCFELIVGPLAPNLSLISAARADGCPAGLQMDTTLNRCLTSAQTANVMNATANCNGDLECYKQNAATAFQDQVNAGNGARRVNDGVGVQIGKGFVTAGVMTGTLAAVYGMASSKAKCASPSFWAMIAAGAAVVAGEMFANEGHRKRLVQIKEDWGKIVSPSQAAGDKDKEREASIEAQSQAFEMLARSEDSLAQAAKLKRNFYSIATTAYAAAVVIALAEMGINKGLKAASVAANTAAVTTNTAAKAAVPFLANAIKGSTTAIALSTALGQATSVDAAGAVSVVAAPLAGQAVTTLATLITTTSAVSTAATASAIAAPIALATLAGPALIAATPLVTAAVSASSLAAAAGVAYTTHTKTVLCIPLGAGIVQSEQENSKSLFAEYTSKSSFNIRQEIQSQYNLTNSEDFASLIMNKKEMDGELATPIDEYEAYKSSFASLESNDRTVFEMFKATSLSVINNLNPITTAYATDTNASETYKEIEAKGGGAYIGLGAGAIAAGALLWTTTLGAKLITYSGRATYSGVMAGLTLSVALHAGYQAKAAEKRAELLREMKDEFNLSSNALNVCKSVDRDDPSKPNCYCYTPENKRNSNRGNSDVCQKLWAGINLTARNYNNSNRQSSKICISNSGRSDPTCACKATKSCMKVGMSGLKGLSAGTMSMVGQSIGGLNSLANGSIDAANVDPGALQNQALRLREIANQMENSKGLADFKKNKDKSTQQIMTEMNKLGSSIPANNLANNNSGFNMPSNPKEAALMLEKEINQPLPTGTSGSDQFVAPSNGPAEEPLEFGMTNNQAAEQDGQIAEVMNQDLDYGSNDINQGSKTNIFEVLSNRYQRSGMRRLFDEKGTTEADKPAESEIAP